MKPWPWLSGGLLALALAATDAQACTPSDTLLGRHALSPAAGQPAAVLLRQQGADLKLEVRREGVSTFLDQPNDRYGWELLYLDGGYSVELCVHAVYSNTTTPGAYALEVLADLTRLDAGEAAALRLLSEAGRLWASGDSADRDLALSHYERVTTLPSGTLGLDRVAGLYAIRGNTLRDGHLQALALSERLAPALSQEALSAYSLHWYRGYALLRVQRFDEALASLEQALALNPPLKDQAEIRNHLGETLLSLDRLDEGEALLRQALEDSGNDFSLLARIHNNLGYALLKRGLRPGLARGESEALLRRSIDEHLVAGTFARGAGDTAELLMIENNLGILYERIRELRKAQHHYRESLLLTQQADDPFGLRVVYQNLGQLNQNLGDYLKSLSYLEQARRMTEGENSLLALRLECLIGTTQRLMQDLVAAIGTHERCQALAAERGELLMRVEALTELGEDYVQAGRRLRVGGSLLEGAETALGDAPSDLYRTQAWSAVHEAWQLLRQVLGMRLGVPWPTEAANFLGLERNICMLSGGMTAWLGDVTQGQGDAALRLAGKVLSRHAVLAQTMGQPALAREDLLLAAALVGRARYNEEVDLLEAAMRVYRAQGRNDFARVCGQLAIERIENLHEGLEAERNGPAWSDRTHEVYVGLADMLLEQALAAGSAGSEGELAREAFAVTEASRAISLRQHLSLPRADSRSTENQRLRARLNTLADQHVALSEGQKSSLLPVDYYHQHDLLELSHLEGLDRVTVPPAFELAAIQERLGEEQAVLYYLLAERQAYVFVVEKRRFQVQALGPLARITSLHRQLVPLLKTPDSAKRQALLALSGFLLPDSLGLADKRDLLVVPHRFLQEIPFAALVPGGHSRGEPLTASHSVRVLPSLSAYFMDKSETQRASGMDLAVFANPVFSAELAGQAGAEGRALDTTWTADLARLPFAEREAESLRRLFSPERTLSFVGQRATLENLGSAAATTARILHIATHGYFHSTSSDNVGLVLAAVNERNEAVSHFVTQSELFATPFDNELVVISGCETAMGMQLSGEGLVGLTRGFLAQGARHVVSTLWPVSDRASYVFMTSFYGHLRVDGDIAQALRRAQEELRALPEYRDPFYWAAYTLTSISPEQGLRFD